MKREIDSLVLSFRLMVQNDTMEMSLYDIYLSKDRVGRRGLTVKPVKERVICHIEKELGTSRLRLSYKRKENSDQQQKSIDQHYQDQFQNRQLVVQ